MATRVPSAFGVAAALAASVSLWAAAPPEPRASPGRQPSAAGQLQESSAVIVGQAIDGATRRPVAGALVTLNGPGGPRRVIAEGEGRFAFRGLPQGEFSITAAKSGWTVGEFGRRRPLGDPLPLLLTVAQSLVDEALLLWRLGAISGTIRDEFGEPMVGIPVRAVVRGYRTGDPRWTTVRSSSTDDRGDYRLGLLPPGEYTVVVPETHQAFSAEQGARADRIAGALVEGDLVIMSSLPTGPGRVHGQPYAYRTTFYPDALTSSSATSMTIRPSDERDGVDFHLRPVRTFAISGHMTRDGAATGGPLTLLRAAPDTAGRLKPISDIPVATSVAGANGRFTFPTVPAGQFVLKSDDESQWARLPITLDDRDITNLTLGLQPGFVVKGRLALDGVAAPMQKALLQAQIRLEVLDPREAATRMARVDAEGQFAITGVVPGSFMFIVPNPGPNMAMRSVTIAGRDVTDRTLDITGNIDNVLVTFTNPLTEIRGRVIGSFDTAAATTVIVFPGGGVPLTDLTWASGSRRFRKLRVQSDGRYVVRGLPAGDYFIAAIPEEAADDWMSTNFLEGLAPLASVVRLDDAETMTQDLRPVEVRR